MENIKATFLIFNINELMFDIKRKDRIQVGVKCQQIFIMVL